MNRGGLVRTCPPTITSNCQLPLDDAFGLPKIGGHAFADLTGYAAGIGLSDAGGMGAAHGNMAFLAEA
jgi:hypothetical protein